MLFPSCPQAAEAAPLSQVFCVAVECTGGGSPLQPAGAGRKDLASYNRVEVENPLLGRDLVR